jgi:dihydroflavonol-4-reductase
MNSPFSHTKLRELDYQAEQFENAIDQDNTICTVAVTGANGFVGSNLTKSLIDRGVDVRAIVRTNRRLPKEIQVDTSRLKYFDIGLESIDDLAKSFEGVDTIIHVAGCTASRKYREYLQGNMRGTRHVLEAARRLANPPRVILISSLAAAGPSSRKQPVKPEGKTHPVSLYGRSKVAAERMAYRYAADLPLTIIRPSIVFGPADHGVLAMMKTIAKARINPVAGYHIPKMSFIHIDDLVNAIFQAIQFGQRIEPGHSGPYGRGIYFVADPESCSFPRFGTWAAEAMGTSWHIPLPIPIWLIGSVAWVNERLPSGIPVLTVDKVREASAPGWECDVSSTMSELNWAPQASLRQRIRQTVEWYRENGWL